MARPGTVNDAIMIALPVNSMDFCGVVNTFSVLISDYKQVSVFFGNTDGIEMFTGSHVKGYFIMQKTT